MRSLPWLQDSTETTTSRPSLKRKRGAAPSTEPADEDLPAKSVEPFDPSEPALSDSDDTTILTYSADNAFDAMIQGYDHDDAYIMVEHDLIEAAKQVTRHIHLEAYQKQATVPVVGQIVRPTTGKPSPRPVVEGESSIEEMESVPDDVSPLGQLLRQRPKLAPVAATPIKRDGARCVRDMDVKTIDLTLDGSQRGEKKETNGPLQTTKNGMRKENRNIDNDVTDDDDEDLDKRPTKVSKLISHPSKPSSKLSKIPTSSMSSRSIHSVPDKPPKTATKTLLDPDWMFNSLWDDAPQSTRPSVRRDKVSLAAQLDESALKLFNDKKAISLKDQFRFMES